MIWSFSCCQQPPSTSESTGVLGLSNIDLDSGIVLSPDTLKKTKKTMRSEQIQETGEGRQGLVASDVDLPEQHPLTMNPTTIK